MLYPTISLEETQELQAHLEAAAAIFFKKTPAEQLQISSILILEFLK